MNATLDDVRRWAWGRQIPVHTTGHPPREVIQAYNRVHPDRTLPMPRQYTRGKRYDYKKEHA